MSVLVDKNNVCVKSVYFVKIRRDRLVFFFIFKCSGSFLVRFYFYYSVGFWSVLRWALCALCSSSRCRCAHQVSPFFSLSPLAANEAGGGVPAGVNTEEWGWLRRSHVRHSQPLWSCVALRVHLHHLLSRWHLLIWNLAFAWHCKKLYFLLLSLFLICNCLRR